MTSPSELLDLFRRSGALLEGHFRLSSGLHSSGYLQSALVLQHPQHAETLGRAIFAERQDGALALRRGFTLGERDRVLVVEDVLTTGGSTRETMQVAPASGARTVGAASIVDRSGGSVRFEVPFHALLDIALPTYEPGECPLCAQGLPVVKPGSRPVHA